MRLGALRLGAASPHALSVPVRKVLLPPNYFKDGVRGDLALLKLRRSVPLSARVQPVCLPEPGAHPPPGTPCWVTGWGSLHPGGEAEGGARGHGGRPRSSPIPPSNRGIPRCLYLVRPPGTQASSQSQQVRFSGVASPTHPCLPPHPFSSLSHKSPFFPQCHFQSGDLYRE